jgi:dTDP-4-amino-4,6-dideoxygalactose transaminase
VGFGFFCDEIVDFEEQFAKYVGTKYAISISSAGAGLDMAMMALDLEPDDEIISPAINFWAADYAILGHCKLVFAEADPRTLCLDPADVERRLTPKTRAINVTHMNGLSASMDDLLEIAKKYPHPQYGPLKVIGDAARACGGEYKGTKVGKKGWMNIFSFHTMKLMTTLGEGGMITTDDARLDQRLRAIRMWGADTDMWGVNYKMTKIQAAAGLVQLRRLDEMNAARYKKGRQRTELLKDVNELTLPYEPPGYKHTYYLYTCMVPREWAGRKRDQLVKTLQKDYGVGAGILNPPTYQMRPFIRLRTMGQDLPISNEIGTRIFSPSLHPLMSDEDNEYIAASISEAVERVAQKKIEESETEEEYSPEVALKDTQELFSDGKKTRKTT